MQGNKGNKSIIKQEEEESEIEIIILQYLF